MLLALVILPGHSERSDATRLDGCSDPTRSRPAYAWLPGNGQLAVERARTSASASISALSDMSALKLGAATLAAACVASKRAGEGPRDAQTVGPLIAARAAGVSEVRACATADLAGDRDVRARPRIVGIIQRRSVRGHTVSTSSSRGHSVPKPIESNHKARVKTACLLTGAVRHWYGACKGSRLWLQASCRHHSDGTFPVSDKQPNAQPLNVTTEEQSSQAPTAHDRQQVWHMYGPLGAGISPSTAAASSAHM